MFVHLLTILGPVPWGAVAWQRVGSQILCLRDATVPRVPQVRWNTHWGMSTALFGISDQPLSPEGRFYSHEGKHSLELMTSRISSPSV